jgi:UDP-N-acetylmuramyl pentapeptide phosphotransferase/UDP-N-acetylglucosamine-1-phosphate transferase
LGASRLDTGDVVLAAVILVATVAMSTIATGALIPLLRRRNLLDRPNERSSHAVPTPRGGGIALIGTVLLAWLGLAEIGRVGAAIVPVCIAAALLAAVCWMDDLYDLSPALRLVAQAAAVAIGLLALPQSSSGLQHWIWPITYDLSAGFVWLWWINAYNFMDGIDGIAGSEAAAISVGLLLVAAVGSAVDPSIVLLAAAIFGASLGFLKWNFSRMRRSHWGAVCCAARRYGSHTGSISINGRLSMDLAMPQWSSVSLSPICA